LIYHQPVSIIVRVGLTNVCTPSSHFPDVRKSLFQIPYIHIYSIYRAYCCFAFIAFKIITLIFFLHSIAVLYDYIRIYSCQISGTRILQYNLYRILLSIFHLVCIIQRSQFLILLLRYALFPTVHRSIFSQTLYVYTYIYIWYSERQLIRFPFM